MISGRVLVVDDTSQIRLLIRLNLELEGFAVQEASDGAQALEMLRHDVELGLGLPDVMTIDAVMEPLDGWATVAAMRRDPVLAGVPVVMVTASVQAHHQRLAEKVGVDAFVTKPFEPESLVQVVRELARRPHYP